jgi:hypothetical protein
MLMWLLAQTTALAAPRLASVAAAFTGTPTVSAAGVSVQLAVDFTCSWTLHGEWESSRGSGPCGTLSVVSPEMVPVTLATTRPLGMSLLPGGGRVRPVDAEVAVVATAVRIAGNAAPVRAADGALVIGATEAFRGAFTALGRGERVVHIEIEGTGHGRVVKDGRPWDLQFDTGAVSLPAEAVLQQTCAAAGSLPNEDVIAIAAAPWASGAAFASLAAACPSAPVFAMACATLPDAYPTMNDAQWTERLGACPTGKDYAPIARSVLTVALGQPLTAEAASKLAALHARLVELGDTNAANALTDGVVRLWSDADGGSGPVTDARVDARSPLLELALTLAAGRASDLTAIEEGWLRAHRSWSGARCAIPDTLPVDVASLAAHRATLTAGARLGTSARGRWEAAMMDTEERCIRGAAQLRRWPGAADVASGPTAEALDRLVRAVPTGREILLSSWRLSPPSDSPGFERLLALSRLKAFSGDDVNAIVEAVIRQRLSGQTDLGALDRDLRSIERLADPHHTRSAAYQEGLKRVQPARQAEADRQRRVAATRAAEARAAEERDYRERCGTLEARSSYEIKRNTAHCMQYVPEGRSMCMEQMKNPQVSPALYEFEQSGCLNEYVQRQAAEFEESN